METTSIKSKQALARTVDIFTNDLAIAENLKSVLGKDYEIDDSMGFDVLSRDGNSGKDVSDIYCFYDQPRSSIIQGIEQDTTFRRRLEHCELRDVQNNGSYIWPPNGNPNYSSEFEGTLLDALRK